jgi:hypothetical protein
MSFNYKNGQTVIHPYNRVLLRNKNNGYVKESPQRNVILGSIMKIRQCSSETGVLLLNSCPGTADD